MSERRQLRQNPNSAAPPSSAYVSRFEPQRVGGAGIDELWVPAEELDDFNDHIVGPIELVAEYRAQGRRSS